VHLFLHQLLLAAGENTFISHAKIIIKKIKFYIKISQATKRNER
jgi:hypothetical protein